MRDCLFTHTRARRRKRLLRTGIVPYPSGAGPGTQSATRKRSSGGAVSAARMQFNRLSQPTAKALQLARHVLDAEALDLVVLADVLIVLEGHAAFLAGLHLGNLILEALER